MSPDPSASAESLDRVTEALAAIDEFVAARLSRLHAPGVAVGLTDRERTLGFVCHGLAGIAARTPVEPDTRFQIGSISKSFAAALVLQEHEAGRVDLPAPGTDSVPWFSLRSRFAPITLHHLLSHTAGRPMGTEFSAEARYALWSLRKTEATCGPGEHFLYSNDGYKLVGLALEAVTGVPVDRLVAARIVAPLAMTDTETTIRRDSPLPVATGYQRLCDDRPAHSGRPLVEAPLVESCTADGSIVSSATDMLAYARLILNRGAAPGGRLLTDESFALWTARVVEDPDERGAHYGYGLVSQSLDGYECVGHSGGMLGFNSLLVTEAATGVGVIVLLNGLDDRLDIARFALEALRAALAGATVTSPSPPVDPTIVGEAAVEYAGAYVAAAIDAAIEPRPPAGDEMPDPRAGGAIPCLDDGDVDRLTLAARDGRLFLRVLDAAERSAEPVGDIDEAGSEVVLERRGDDLFLAPHSGCDRFHLRFERDDGGAVVALSFGPSWFAREGWALPAASAADPSWAPLTGAYRSHDPWNPVFRVISRRGRLLMVAPWLYPADELELVPLPDGVFRVGAPCWLPDRLSFDTVIDGHATRAVYDGTPFYRTFT